MPHRFGVKCGKSPNQRLAYKLVDRLTKTTFFQTTTPTGTSPCTNVPTGGAGRRLSSRRKSRATFPQSPSRAWHPTPSTRPGWQSTQTTRAEAMASPPGSYSSKRTEGVCTTMPLTLWAPFRLVASSLVSVTSKARWNVVPGANHPFTRSDH